MNIEVTTGPASEPLTLVQGKKQCEIPLDVTDHDDLITLLIKEGRQYVENRSGIALFTQAVVQRWDCFPHSDKYDKYGALELGYGKIQSVTHLKYTDTAEAPQTLAVNTDYKLSLTSTPPKIVPAYDTAWPTALSQVDSVWCEYVRGWATVGEIPGQAFRAISLYVATNFACREDKVRRFPSAMDMLIDQLKAHVL